MESGTSKLRVVWVCHFMNDFIKKKLKLPQQMQEYAPWITLGLNEIRSRTDVELHVIAPFYGISASRTFSEDNIHYYCLRIGVPFRNTNWPSVFRFDQWTNYYFFNVRVKKIVDKINPDIINLHGAENAYYSSSVLKLKKYPVLVTIQGFLSLNIFNNDSNPVVKKRLQIEHRILKEMKNFGVEANFIKPYIQSLNPDAKVFFYHYPYAHVNAPSSVLKEYDLVFFANLVKAKGIEDLLAAILILKGKKPDISLIIMGKGDEAYIEKLKNYIKDHDLGHNIVFKGFISSQKDMLEEVAKARITVLPTYNDTIPGTIVESMHLGIPVITYNAGGTPDINIGDERIILVEKGNIDRLAHEIAELLSDVNRQKNLAVKALKYASAEFDNKNSIDRMISTYREIISETT